MISITSYVHNFYSFFKNCVGMFPEKFVKSRFINNVSKYHLCSQKIFKKTAHNFVS